MGLFDRLKSDLNHGGLKLQVQAPASVTAGQPFSVNVNITATESRAVESLKVEVQAKAQTSGVAISSNGIGTRNGQTTYQTVAEVESREPLTVNPGETKTVTIQLSVNPTSLQGPQLGGDSSSGVAQALGAVLSAAQALEHVSFIYRIHASAKIPGVDLGPSDDQAIQVLPAPNDTPGTVA